MFLPFSGMESIISIPCTLKSEMLYQGWVWGDAQGLEKEMRSWGMDKVPKIQWRGRGRYNMILNYPEGRKKQRILEMKCLDEQSCSLKLFTLFEWKSCMDILFI